MLVRVEEASRNLPQGLKDLGARVTEVAGYRMAVKSNIELVKRVFGQRLDVLALANPAAVRFLDKGANELGIDLQKSLKEVIIAAVGPKGHIADLVEALEITI